MTPILHTRYESPIGTLTLVATAEGLCGLYFEQHKPAPKREGWHEQDDPRFEAAKQWLRAYFAGETPRDMPPLAFTHGTPFQRRVWEALRLIPRGSTTTYAQLARSIGAEKAVRAVGAAVGRNPISILIPCHRVLGSSGSLTGFAGGVERKRWLLQHENVLSL